MDEARLARVLAYIDGELDAEAVRAFESEMAADAALAAEVRDHRALASRVGGAFAPVLHEPIPARLGMVASAANDRSMRRWAPWAAAAASLVLGVVIGRAALPTHDLAQGSDGLIARGELARGLSTQLAAERGVVRIGLTFRDTTGRWCRSFESDRDHLAGLACRQAGRWRVEVATATAAPGAGSDYRTAASALPPAVLAAVDTLRAEGPLDAAAERQARDAGWR